MCRNCKDCGIKVNPFHGNMVILPDDLWIKVCDKIQDVICDFCIEKRLGRKLKLDDLPIEGHIYGRRESEPIRTIPANMVFLDKRNLWGT